MLNEQKRISVVIPTRNREGLLRRALLSIVNAVKPTAIHIEVIVVDDCSADSVDVSDFVSLNINLIRLHEWLGPGVARNTGINAASGSFIFLLDDDDELLSDAFIVVLEKLSPRLNHEQYPVYFFATDQACLTQELHIFSLKEYVNNDYGDAVPIIIKEHWMRHGYYYPNLKIGGESLLWIDIAAKAGLPVFQHVIVKVNHDAPLRLTHVGNQFARADEYMQYQKLVIEKIEKKRKGIRIFFYKKLFGFIIYSILAQKQMDAIAFLRQIRLCFGVKILVYCLFAIPKKVIEAGFVFYRNKSFR